MWSRREQYQAYQFLNRRIVSAVLSGEPESNELPMRRFGTALFSGITVAILVIAGFTIYGIARPGGGKPAENVIIMERETGAPYLYLQGQLHPVLNFTSARLVLGQANPSVRSLSQASLRDVPRGQPVGIPDAPASLPDRAALIGLPWSLCSAPVSPESVELGTYVLVGWAPLGGVVMDDSVGMLVTTPGSDDRFLVWQDHRLRVDSNAVIAALGWAAVSPTPVTPSFVDALPAGPDLAPLAIPGAGQPAVEIAGTRTTVGQVFRTEPGLSRAAGQHFVMLSNGLAPVGELTARLWAANGRQITEISAQEAGDLLIQTTVEPPGLPAAIPTAFGEGTGGRDTICAIYRGSTDVEHPVSVENLSELGDDVTQAAATIPATAADRVALPGGRAALAATLTPAGSAAPGTVFVVTDQGTKYPLPREDTAAVQASLGYEGVEPVAVPGAILDLIPTGPVLDPVAAATFAEPAVPGPGTAATPEVTVP